MKFPLTGASYVARNPIANCQSCVNLYYEPAGTPDAPFPGTMYPSPGLDLLTDASAIGGICRGVYWASDGILYAIFGEAVVSIAQGSGAYTIHGYINAGTNPVGITDNTQVLVLVDGSIHGWTMPLGGAGAVMPIQDTTNTFVGSVRVDFIDTFTIFHGPNRRMFYCTESNSMTFNPLFFANKIGYNDGLVTLAALHDCVWLFGYLTTEIWFNAGNPQFPFQRMPQSILQYGCAAPYSVVVIDNAVYWLSIDRGGSRIFMRGEGYAAKRVSNFAIEQQWAQYASIQDVTCFAYQGGGHIFVVVQFLVANATWVYDASTGFWHRRAYINNTNGWLPWVGTNWYNNVIVGDRASSRLFLLDVNNTTDDGTPIVRERTWPHALADQRRMSHNQFVAAMQGTNLSPDSVALSWSDDGGQTWGTPVTQTTNNASNGQYSWRRLGMARDRVYRLTWSSSGQTALNGAWLEAEPAGT